MCHRRGLDGPVIIYIEVQAHVMHDIKDCKREVLHCRMTKIIGSMEHTLAIRGEV